MIDRSTLRNRIAALAVAGLALTALVAGAQEKPDPGAGDRPSGGDKQVQRVVVRAGDGEPGKVRVFVRKDDGGTVEEVLPGAGEDGPWKHELIRGLPGGMSWIAAGPRGYLGIQLTELTPELRTHFGGDEEAGVLVGRVEPDSPADRAGVRVGDLITRIDGEPVGSSHDVIRAIADREEGAVVSLELLRDGRPETLSAAVERRDVPAIDVRQVIRELPRSFPENDLVRGYDIDVEALNDQMQDLDRYFESPEWKAQVEKLQDVSVELQKRLESLEIELDDLEKKIDVEVEVAGPDDPH